MKKNEDENRKLVDKLLQSSFFSSIPFERHGSHLQHKLVGNTNLRIQSGFALRDYCFICIAHMSESRVDNMAHFCMECEFQICGKCFEVEEHLYPFPQVMSRNPLPFGDESSGQVRTRPKYNAHVISQLDCGLLYEVVSAGRIPSDPTNYFYRLEGGGWTSEKNLICATSDWRRLLESIQIKFPCSSNRNMFTYDFILNLFSSIDFSTLPELSISSLSTRYLFLLPLRQFLLVNDFTDYNFDWLLRQGSVFLKIIRFLYDTLYYSLNFIHNIIITTKSEQDFILSNEPGSRDFSQHLYTEDIIFGYNDKSSKYSDSPLAVLTLSKFTLCQWTPLLLFTIARCLIVLLNLPLAVHEQFPGKLFRPLLLYLLAFIETCQVENVHTPLITVKDFSKNLWRNKWFSHEDSKVDSNIYLSIASWLIVPWIDLVYNIPAIGISRECLSPLRNIILSLPTDGDLGGRLLALITNFVERSSSISHDIISLDILEVIPKILNHYKHSSTIEKACCFIQTVLPYCPEAKHIVESSIVPALVHTARIASSTDVVRHIFTCFANLAMLYPEICSLRPFGDNIELSDKLFITKRQHMKQNSEDRDLRNSLPMEYSEETDQNSMKMHEGLLGDVNYTASNRKLKISGDSFAADTFSEESFMRLKINGFPRDTNCTHYRVLRTLARGLQQSKSHIYSKSGFNAPNRKVIPHRTLLAVQDIIVYTRRIFREVHLERQTVKIDWDIRGLCLVCAKIHPLSIQDGWTMRGKFEQLYFICQCAYCYAKIDDELSVIYSESNEMVNSPQELISENNMDHPESFEDKPKYQDTFPYFMQPITFIGSMLTQRIRYPIAEQLRAEHITQTMLTRVHLDETVADAVGKLLLRLGESVDTARSLLSSLAHVSGLNNSPYAILAISTYSHHPTIREWLTNNSCGELGAYLTERLNENTGKSIFSGSSFFLQRGGIDPQEVQFQDFK